MEFNSDYGSSPRMWGTLSQRTEQQFSCRFIPTDVGNAHNLPISSPCCPVHPHGCGERCHPCVYLSFLIGSSPRMWGTRLYWRFVYGYWRFIPTDVGNAISMRSLAFISSVHPHGCGERIKSELSATIKNGSSPRMWGTLNATGQNQTTRRFIPTDVGNAKRGGISSAMTAVHPHGCGERP